MSSERRSQEEIRRAIASEREELAHALVDVREGIASKRRTAAIVGGAILAVLAAGAVLKIARRVTTD
jgi:hypothetical protein